MSEYYFQTRNLSVGYNGRALIRDINIGVRRGEIVSLIGPNGAGKSTILKSITRQLKAVAGTVLIDRRALDGFSHQGLARRVAVLLTERARPELMTCRDVVAAGRYPYTGRLGLLARRDEEKVSEAMRIVRVLDLSERSFSRISDGQRQRVLLARAICQEPEIIVLDEPTSYLDIRHKLGLLDILRDMAREKGITVVMSLHEIDLAQKISDRILCVKGDAICGYGPPGEIFSSRGIRDLFDIDQGFYDPLFGGVELARPEGRGEVFVLSACGTGIPVYRALQKENTPFSAGVLYKNDVDCHLARMLAVEVVEEKPFCEIGQRAFDRAMELIRDSRYVVDAGVTIGACNRRMRQLLCAADGLGKLKRGVENGLA